MQFTSFDLLQFLLMLLLDSACLLPLLLHIDKSPKVRLSSNGILSKPCFRTRHEEWCAFFFILPSNTTVR